MEIPTHVSLSDSTVGDWSRLLQMQGFTLTRNPRFPVMCIVFATLGFIKKLEQGAPIFLHTKPQNSHTSLCTLWHSCQKNISLSSQGTGRKHISRCLRAAMGDLKLLRAAALPAASLSMLLKPSSQTFHSTLAITPTWQNCCLYLLFMVDFCRVLEVKQLKPIFVNDS